jgi:hypothetical protein
MGTAFVAGHDFADSDAARAAEVAIVNEAFVRRYFPEVNPVGQRFIREDGPRPEKALEIVGVVRDSKWIDLRSESPVMYYVPWQRSGRLDIRMAIRATGGLDVLRVHLVDTARAVDPQIRLTNVVPFREIVNRTLVTERLVAHVSAAFAFVALLIACIGLYGILAYAVVRRRREIGVRIAVGASPGAVEWMMLRESLALVAVGFLVGVPAAMAVTRLASSMLFGLAPGDPATIVATLAILMMATLAAAYLPARRAATIDPIQAMKSE